jgi:hypothetical protein
MNEKALKNIGRIKKALATMESDIVAGKMTGTEPITIELEEQQVLVIQL